MRSSSGSTFEIRSLCSKRFVEWVGRRTYNDFYYIGYYIGLYGYKVLVDEEVDVYADILCVTFPDGSDIVRTLPFHLWPESIGARRVVRKGFLRARLNFGGPQKVRFTERNNIVSVFYCVWQFLPVGRTERAHAEAEKQ